MSASQVFEHAATVRDTAAVVKPPVVSVLMPAYNRERFIGAAIESILDQTLTDWELIVVDDGSTDSTVQIAAAFDDPRIRVIQLGANGGISRARNRGLEEARGEYVAWLDSDDIARPKRLEKQVAFLRKHPEIALVGGCARKIDDDDNRLRGVRVPPMAHDDIDCRQLLTSSFQQSSITGRADVLKAFPYDPAFEVCEDVDVCVRIADKHLTANMPEVIIDRRMHGTQVSREQKHKILAAQLRISRPLFDKIGWNISDDELVRLCALSRAPDRKPTAEDISWAEGALWQLLAANARSRAMSQPALKAFAGLLMFDRYRRFSRARALRALLTSPFAGGLVSRPSLSWLSAALFAIVRPD